MQFITDDPKFIEFMRHLEMIRNTSKRPFNVSNTPLEHINRVTPDTKTHRCDNSILGDPSNDPETQNLI